MQIPAQFRVLGKSYTSSGMKTAELEAEYLNMVSVAELLEITQAKQHFGSLKFWNCVTTPIDSLGCFPASRTTTLFAT
jgi:hypothetical protein